MKTPSIEAARQLEFLVHLLDFMEERFRSPECAFKYLRSRNKCGNGTHCQHEYWCDSLLDKFAAPQPWQALPEFFNWAIGPEGWYSTTRRYEEPINAVFTLPAVAQFLRRRHCRDTQILQVFDMEFKGRNRANRPIPPCLWTGISSVCTNRKAGENLCCDFYLKPPLPATVAEIKVVVSQSTKTTKSVFDEFRRDLAKCTEWLEMDAYLPFGFERFQYALAVLIDLRECHECYRQWHNEVDEGWYRERRIIARLIAPNHIHRRTSRSRSTTGLVVAQS